MLKYGIVGLPNVGKSTLFNALSNNNVTAANFPFCTIDPNVGIVKVPDERIISLAALVAPQKLTPTFIEFVDIAGLVQGAHQGEGLGNKFLANIREVDAIVHVVRCFQDQRVVHVAGQVDPVFDKEVIDHELAMSDLESIRKRIGKVEKIARSGDQKARQELNLLRDFEAQLLQEGHTRNATVDSSLDPLIKSWQLLTRKPVLYVANVDETTLQKGTNLHVDQFRKAIQNELSKMICVCATLETQMMTLTSREKELFLQDYGLNTTPLEKLIRASYELLRLITYFTVGPQEVKAWTIPQGTKAPQAAGVIHSDFEKKFIKAEVIKPLDYLHYKTEWACKEAGKVRIEGKQYVVEDGDILHFRHG